MTAYFQHHFGTIYNLQQCDDKQQQLNVWICRIERVCWKDVKETMAERKSNKRRKKVKKTHELNVFGRSLIQISTPTHTSNQHTHKSHWYNECEMRFLNLNMNLDAVSRIIAVPQTFCFPAVYASSIKRMCLHVNVAIRFIARRPLHKVKMFALYDI